MGSPLSEEQSNKSATAEELPTCEPNSPDEVFPDCVTASTNSAGDVTQMRSLDEQMGRLGSPTKLREPLLPIARTASPLTTHMGRPQPVRKTRAATPLAVTPLLDPPFL